MNKEEEAFIDSRVFKIPLSLCFQPPNKPHPLDVPAPSRGVPRGPERSGGLRRGPSLQNTPPPPYNFRLRGLERSKPHKMIEFSGGKLSPV
jgi:hypothetical protein